MIKKFKITTIVGTRPELIRLSSIIDVFDKIFEHRLIHTGQNSDSNLSDIFFDELNIRKPNRFIKIESKSLGVFLGKIFVEIESELNDFKPDAVVILGDTNSALSAIIAKRNGIPVYHLEAGNRSFDEMCQKKLIEELLITLLILIWLILNKQKKTYYAKDYTPEILLLLAHHYAKYLINIQRISMAL